MKCPACGAELGSVSFRTVCPGCGKAVHSCMMCDFHDPNAYHGCREGAEDVRYKDESNFCESFRLRQSALPTQNSKEKASRDALKALFGD